jgi:hypothetical protein
MKVFFSDFAVGAYQSDALFVVRTRPVIDMTATLTISPSPIQACIKRSPLGQKNVAL